MEPMKVDLTVGLFGHTGRITLDGVDISSHVRGVTVKADVGDMTDVTIDLALTETVVDCIANVEGIAIPARPLTIRFDERTWRATTWHLDGNTVIIDEAEEIVA